MEFNRCMGCMKEYEGEGSCPHCGFDLKSYKTVPHHLMPGTILNGKYILGKVLGEGGFGISYVGWDLNLEYKVAIKEYYPVSYVTRQAVHTPMVTSLTGRNQEYYQRGLDKFVEEARSLAKFTDLPGIVPVRDYFQENGTAYIVMGFAEGKTLKKIIQEHDGILSADHVIGMMRTVIESLEEVHKKGIIHRDISPDNLMVDANNRVKLLDFGAARNYVSEEQHSLSVILKPGFAPEEQYRSHGEQGPWTDVYALCATIYRAVTGILPPESLDRMRMDEIKSPSSLGVPIKPQQEEALMKGLAVHKKDRFANMKELQDALYQKTPDVEAESKPKPAQQPQCSPKQDPVQIEKPEPKESANRKRAFIIVGVAILAICVIGLKSREDQGITPNETKNGKMAVSNTDLKKTLSKGDFIGKTKAHWEAWTDEEGVRYVGFRNEDGYVDGEGKAVYENGDEYEGGFVDGEKKGYGKYTWVNGDWYTGNFDDTMSGFGTRYWSKSGEIFQGEWKNGERDGLGVLRNNKGTYTVGVWKDDKLSDYLESTPSIDGGTNNIYVSDDLEFSGRAVIVYGENGLYIGEISGQEENGWGYFFSSNGNCSEGQYKNGKADGIRIGYLGGGSCDIAYFSEARVDGPSVHIDLDGERREGFYNYKDERQVVGRWIDINGEDGSITTGISEASGEEIIDTEADIWIEEDSMYIGSRENGGIEGDFIDICADGSHAIENLEKEFRVRFYPFYDGSSDIYFIWGPTESDDWAEGALCAGRQEDGRIGLSIFEDGEWILLEH